MGGLGAGGEEAGTGGQSGSRLPLLLSETGLYESDMKTLAPGVRSYRPQFPLWTDGAKKRRWIKLPPGETIDTSDMDFWEYPIGTQLWKEFERDDIRVETRLLQKSPTGVWRMVAYQWRDDLSEADAVPEGVVNAGGTQHDIPSQEQCWQCHNQVPDRVIGFTAIQLSHPGDDSVPGEVEANEWTMISLGAASLLTDLPSNPLTLNGPSEEVEALGYLHANCGHCHHPKSSAWGRVDMQLWLSAAALDPTSSSPSVTSTVNVPVALPSDSPAGATHRVYLGDLDKSAIYQRFVSLGQASSMPPLGTEVVDPAGEAALNQWINSLTPP